MENRYIDIPSYIGKNILFFDSDCLFCKKSILWIYKRDLKKSIFYGSTKLSSGKVLIPNLINIGDSTVIFIENYGTPEEKVSYRSTAILRVLELLYKLPFSKLSFGYPLWDVFYRLIARYRRRLINNKSCEIPKDTKQFID